MTLKIYIDTNIFLDFILKRDNGISREILYYLHSKDFIVALNDISVVNIHYFAKKNLKMEEVKDFIDIILDTCLIVSVDKNILKTSINSNFIDFEDAVQYFCAKSIDADLIITNDKKGFRDSRIDTITSQNFYKRYIR